MKFVIALVALVAPALASPTIVDRETKPTFSYVPDMQQFINSYNGGNVNWTAAAISMNKWASQAAENAKVKSGSSSSPSSSSSSSVGASPSPSSGSTTSNTTNTTTSPAQDTVNKVQFLSLHNDFRNKYKAQNVTWNDTLAVYAFKAASTCKYGHTNGPYGENIAAGVGGGYNVKMGFQSWANESALYNFSKPGYNETTGHFTQLVWKSTTQIGCVAVSCADNTIFQGYRQNSTYLVCEYSPPGNWVDPRNATNTAKYFMANVGQ